MTEEKLRVKIYYFDTQVLDDLVVKLTFQELTEFREGDSIVIHHKFSNGEFPEAYIERKEDNGKG